MQSQNLKLSSGLPKPGKRAESQSNASDGMHKSKTLNAGGSDKPIARGNKSAESNEGTKQNETCDVADE